MIKVGDYVRLLDTAECDYLRPGSIYQVQDVNVFEREVRLGDDDIYEWFAHDEYVLSTKDEADGWVQCDMTEAEFKAQGLLEPGVFVKLNMRKDSFDADYTPENCRKIMGPILLGDYSFNLAYGYDGYLGEWDDVFRIIAYRDCRALLGLKEEA